MVPRPEVGAALARARRAIARANRALGVLERALWPRRVRAPARVGVLREGMLGDVAVALAAIDAVRRAFPRAELVLLTSPGPRGAPGAAELLAGTSAVHVVRWHREDLARWRGRLALLRRLRALRLDLVVVLPAALTSPRREAAHALALRFAGVRHARGFAVANARWSRDADARAAHDAANERAADWDARGDAPQALRLLAHARAVLASCGVASAPAGDAAVLLALGETERDAARAALVEHGLATGGRPLLAVAPGAKLELKRWPAERFAEVAARWAAAGGAVAVLGAPSERELAAQVAAAANAVAPGSAAVLAGVLDVRESAALLAIAAALVANDSGPAHLAAAVGCPVVVVQAARDRRGAWAPAGPGAVRVLRADVACAPCFAERCPEGHRCLLAFDAERVLAELAALARSVPEALAAYPARLGRPRRRDQDRERFASASGAR